MYTQVEKPKENKSQLAQSTVTQTQCRSNYTSRFVDIQPKIVAQRKLLAKANNSTQAKQLKELQETANNSPQAKRTIYLAINNTAIQALKNSTIPIKFTERTEKLLQRKSEIIQRDTKILNPDDHSTYVIGINLMPSTKITPSGIQTAISRLSKTGVSNIGSVYAGHSSLISGEVGFNPPRGMLDEWLDEQLGQEDDEKVTINSTSQYGFSPSSALKSAKIGLGSLLGGLGRFLGIFQNVTGSFHPDHDVTKDPQAHQIVVRVSGAVYQAWNDAMKTKAEDEQDSSGIYSFHPSEMESDNCVTVALKTAVDFCLGYMTQINISNQDRISLEVLLQQLLKSQDAINARIRNNVGGLQGEMMRQAVGI